MQLTVPAGAVSAVATFSIQPFSNECPGGMAMAYRLLPEGITFAQPVTLSFSYEVSLLANEKFLAMAYQSADKTWLPPKNISLNVVDNKISVQSKHFSDWGMFEKLAIEPSDASVKINESLALEVILVGEPKTMQGEDKTNETLTAGLKKWRVT